MARRVRSSPLETRTARLKLPLRHKPYWVRLSEGLSLGYRRLRNGGTWSMRAADGKGGNWVKLIGPADDLEGVSGALSFFEAQLRARQLVQGAADNTKPQTVAEAVTSYRADLKARGGEEA